MEIKIVSGEDWEGLYINGILVEENHHIRVDDVMVFLYEEFGINYEELAVDYDWLEDEGCLPKLLKDIPESVLE